MKRNSINQNSFNMELILGALAEAIISLLINDLSERRSIRFVRGRLQGESQEKLALQRALATAYLKFKKKYFSLAASFFDEQFLKKSEVAIELTKILTPNRSPNPSIIVDAWMSQFSIQPSIDLTEPVSFFLLALEQETKSEPLLKPFIDSRALDQLYSISETVSNSEKLQTETNKILEGIREDIRNLLVEAFNFNVEVNFISSDPQVEEDSKPVHNLPNPDYGEFVGRDHELHEIERLIRPYPHSQYHLIVISGIGGVGKSALALKTAYRYVRGENEFENDEKFDAVVWASAKKSVLTGDGIEPRIPALHSLSDILNNLIMVLDWEKPLQDSQLINFVIKKLAQSKVLLIIDNFETIDDKYILSFIRELPPPTKAIVTTRHQIDVAYPIRLSGMPVNDARLIIEREAIEKNVTLNEGNIRLLYKRTGGVPLAMVWSIAKMGFGYGIENVMSKLGEPSSDISEFCFHQSVEVIKDTPSYQILLAIAALEVGGTRSRLSRMTKLSTFDLEDGLVILEKLSLINKDGDYFIMLPLTLGYCKEELNSDSEQAAIVRKTIPEIQRGIDEEALTRYFGHLKSTYDQVRIFGRLDRFNLYDLYVEVEFLDSQMKTSENSFELIEEGLKSDAFQKKRRTSLGRAALETNQYLYVLGSPGSGKTTFLRFLALEYTNLAPKEKIPVLISIRELSQSGLTMLDFIIRELELGDFLDVSNFVYANLSIGRFLVLLDGLDEVIGEEKQNVIKAIRDLIRFFPDNQYVITSRFAAAEFTFETFSYVQISEFSNQQMEALVNQWFNHDQRANSLISDLYQNPRLLALAQIPLFLTLLCSLYEVSLALPVKRVDLYHESADILLGGWDEARNINLDSYPSFTSQMKRELLAYIAIKMQIDGVYYQHRQELLFQIAEYISPITNSNHFDDSKNILNLLTDRTGLIKEEGLGNYGFIHLIFLEYFAANHIVFHADELESYIEQYFVDQRWQEVFLLVASMLREPDQFFVLGIKKLELLRANPENFRYIKELLVSSLVDSNVKNKESVLETIHNIHQ